MKIYPNLKLRMLTLLCLLSTTLAHAMERDRQKETDEDKGQEQTNKRARTETIQPNPVVDATQPPAINESETEQARAMRELRELSTGNEVVQAVEQAARGPLKGKRPDSSTGRASLAL